MRALSAGRAVLYGGLTVGILDGLDAIVFFGLRNDVGPLRIFKGIAGGLLGREAATAGGWPTALLGLVLHFTIATTIVAVFYLFSRRFPFLTRRPFVWGPLYGVAVYLTMNLVVLPLSALHGTGLPQAVPVLLNGLLIHMIGVGTPSALFARAGEST
ncbi:MAG TPA: hypothetical protein VGQ18_07615 [Gemmatimonadales bacterium]|nr:hypothetical protein [Gemmatimonadales bacterium]